MKKEYYIVYQTTARKTETEVNEKLKEGWELAGNLFFTNFGYAQPMIRTTEGGNNGTDTSTEM